MTEFESIQEDNSKKKEMGCTSCSSNGTSAGCKSNGSCSTGGCGKLGVYDWLSGMELAPGQRPFDVAEIRFKNSRKGFYRIGNNLSLQAGDAVAVESSPGHDVGVVSVIGELARIQMQTKKVEDNHELRKIHRKASEEDIKSWQEAREMEWETMMNSRKFAIELGLEMKISDVEYQADKSKCTFYYTADGRVDFRMLIKKLAETFKVRIEMRQIGARQEAGRLGGIGSCGRELCCSTWLTDFRSVSTSSARYQQLSLNPQKMAGQCGKLKCCLNYELDMYMDAIKDFPANDTKLATENGRAFHFKSDIFKRTMWFIMEGEGISSPIELSVDDVKDIVEINKAGKKIASLKDYEKVVEIIPETEYLNVVGQDDLTRFDRKRKPNRKNKRKPNPQNRGAQKAKGEGGNKPQENRSKSNNQKGKPNKPKGEKSATATKPQPKGQKTVEGKTPKAKRPNNRKPNNNRKPKAEGDK